MEEIRSDIPQALMGAEFPTPKRELTVTADCEQMGKMLHEGRTEQFVFYSDEPEAMGGESGHPKPLSYIAAGTGF
ncbi:MAG: hypothetical protein IIB14_08520 [Chloroflexi bacterium]|nr:hypothetical protein [Chloroflexota bacterium]